MEKALQAAYKATLQEMLRDLDKGDEAGRDAMKTVTLDQQAVGRLSRMDALQQQTMAKAQNARREQSRIRIQSAIRRLDEGEFGYCVDCGSEISLKRLDLDPATPKCISCASG